VRKRAHPRANPVASECADLGRSYLAAKDRRSTQKARRLYRQLARETSRLFSLIRLKVEFTHDDPYPSLKVMRKQVEETGVLRVFAGGDPVLLSREENLKGRAVHDLFAHLVAGAPFHATGEFNAFEAQAAIYSPAIRPVLFNEIVGQTCAYLANKSQHADQKVIFWPKNIEESVAGAMRKKFKRGLGLAGVVDRGWVDPEVIRLAVTNGYAESYVYAVLEEGAMRVNPKGTTPKWDRFLKTKVARGGQAAVAFGLGFKRNPSTEFAAKAQALSASDQQAAGFKQAAGQSKARYGTPEVKYPCRPPCGCRYVALIGGFLAVRAKPSSGRIVSWSHTSSNRPPLLVSCPKHGVQPASITGKPFRVSGAKTAPPRGTKPPCGCKGCGLLGEVIDSHYIAADSPNGQIVRWVHEAGDNGDGVKRTRSPVLVDCQAHGTQIANVPGSKVVFTGRGIKG
jgi:hypothetical protein